MCDQDRIPAEKLEDALFGRLLEVLGDSAILRRATNKFADAWNETAPNSEREAKKIRKEIRETQAAIDKYLRAFEEGTMPPDSCGPRIRELGELLGSLEARKAVLESEEVTSFDPPKLEAVQDEAKKLIGLLEQFRSEDASSLKDMLGKLVPRIDVEHGQIVYPAIHLPLVFIMDNWVGPADHKTNQMEISSDLLEVSWTNHSFEPEASARRSEIQQARHSEDSVFHEKALRNLEKGRLTEWTEERILQAIRDFQTRRGRPPRYEELRAANGLPDYKTIWRKFGSSRDAIKAASDGRDSRAVHRLRLGAEGARRFPNRIVRKALEGGS